MYVKTVCGRGRGGRDKNNRNPTGKIGKKKGILIVAIHIKTTLPIYCAVTWYLG